MRTLALLTRVLCGALPVFGCEAEAQAARANAGFAVVELFTSEGCSSCPKADDVLNELSDEARDGRPVYTLAFHVDYWDKIGWRDPYSASWATDHQREYIAPLQTQGLYTPQMVVNGRDEFIGQHAGHARASITRERSKPRSQELQVTARADAERVQVHFDLSGVAPNEVVRVALVDDEASTDVLAGENAGRRLRHTHVVRGFASTQAGKSGELSITWPSDFTPEKRVQAFVIAYAQDRATREITSAARAAVSFSRGL